MKNLLLSLLSAILFVVAVAVKIPIFIYFAFVPILIMENQLLQSKKNFIVFFRYLILPIFIYTLSTFKFLSYSLSAYIIFSLITSIIYAFLLSLFHLFREKINNFYGYFIFLGIIISIERLSLLTDSPLPAIILGNYGYIQLWHSMTGIIGSSLWILLINLLIFNIIITLKPFDIKNFILGIISLTIVIALPIFGNFLLKKQLNKLKPKANFTVFINNKKSQGSLYSSLNKLAQLTINQINQIPDYIILQTQYLNIKELFLSDSLKNIYKLLNKSKKGIIIFSNETKTTNLRTLTNNSTTVAYINHGGIEFFSKYSKIDRPSILNDSNNIGILLGNDIYNCEKIRPLILNYSNFLIFYGKAYPNIIKNIAIQTFETIISVIDKTVYLPDGTVKKIKNNYLTISPLKVFTYYVNSGEYIGNLMAFLTILILIAGFSKMSMNEDILKTIKK